MFAKPLLTSMKRDELKVPVQLDYAMAN